MDAKIIGQFIPDLLSFCFIAFGSVTYSKVMRVKVRGYLAQVKTRICGEISDGVNEDTLMRLYKLVSGGTTDFAAIVLGGTSTLYAIAQINSTWAIILGWPLFLALVAGMHLLWSAATLDTVVTYSRVTKTVAICLLVSAVLLKVFHLAQGMPTP